MGKKSGQMAQNPPNKDQLTYWGNPLNINILHMILQNIYILHLRLEQKYEQFDIWTCDKKYLTYELETAVLSYPQDLWECDGPIKLVLVAI